MKTSFPEIQRFHDQVKAMPLGELLFGKTLPLDRVSKASLKFFGNLDVFGFCDEVRTDHQNERKGLGSIGANSELLFGSFVSLSTWSHAQSKGVSHPFDCFPVSHSNLKTEIVVGSTVVASAFSAVDCDASFTVNQSSQIRDSRCLHNDYLLMGNWYDQGSTTRKVSPNNPSHECPATLRG